GQGVPTQWRLILDHPQFERFDLSHLRIAATGGASVSPELVREMERRLRCPVVIAYASTEAGLISGSDPGDPPELIANTVGRARKGVELQVIDPEGSPVVGVIGAVRCRSSAIMKGYWQDEATTSKVVDDEGWLNTGDLGSIDEAGVLSLVGRSSEMFLRGAYKVYATEVERVLSSHPQVSQAAVVPKPDRVLGEIGVAFVVPVSGASPDHQQLRRWVREFLADYKAPDITVVVDQLPVTAVGKVDKHQLTLRTVRLTRPV